MSILIEQDSDMVALRRGTRKFLWFGLLATLAIVAAILVRQGLFRQTASLSFVTDSAQDISQGQAVKIAGFRVGAVDSVTLRADGNVAVELSIDADYMRFVTRDAEIQLRKEGLVGSAILEIMPGADRSRLAANEAQLKFSRADGLTSMANSLRDKIFPILEDVKTMTGMLADSRQGLSLTLAQVRETTSSLNTLLQTGNRQVEQIGQGTGRVLGKVEESLTQAAQTMERVSERLPSLLDKTQSIVEHMERISAEAESSVPQVLRDGTAVAADVREMVIGVKSAWPISSLVDPKSPVPHLPADSDPRAESSRAAP
jgi:phospholipid/cholesterol/gamma-HCH transport system substrate-binding protein